MSGNPPLRLGHRSKLPGLGLVASGGRVLVELVARQVPRPGRDLGGIEGVAREAEVRVEDHLLGGGVVGDAGGDRGATRALLEGDNARGLDRRFVHRLREGRRDVGRARDSGRVVGWAGAHDLGRGEVNRPGSFRWRGVDVPEWINRPYPEGVRAVAQASVFLGEVQALKAAPSRLHSVSVFPGEGSKLILTLSLPIVPDGTPSPRVVPGSTGSISCNPT
jgi:hypothetical protein